MREGEGGKALYGRIMRIMKIWGRRRVPVGTGIHMSTNVGGRAERHHTH